MRFVLNASHNHRTFIVWCQGQDSNLRSPSGQRFYRPSVLATHPPWLMPLAVFRFHPLLSRAGPAVSRGALLLRVEPEGGFEPSTYRLQIGCAAIAPLGPERPSCSGPNKIRPPEIRGSQVSIWKLKNWRQQFRLGVV